MLQTLQQISDICGPSQVPPHPAAQSSKVYRTVLCQIGDFGHTHIGRKAILSILTAQSIQESSIAFKIVFFSTCSSNPELPNVRIERRSRFAHRFRLTLLRSLSTASRPLLAPRTTVAHGAGTDSQQSSSQHRQRSDSDYKRPWKQKQFEERTDPPGLSTDVGSVEVPYTPSESLSGWDSEVHLASSPKRSRRGGVPPAPLALGGLGPDKESEAYKARLALRLKQKQYAEVLRQQLPVTTKPPPLKPRPQTPTKRDKMLAYASALPPPNTVASTTPRPRKEKAQKTTEANYVAAETEMRRLIELEHEHELNMQLVESIRRELKL
ncbi:hypothetical protein BJ742DRAFT_406766 [Cladochytrium replicatum]|nr:hypothetical protein BJ742DRAFT_406766 [Cladochytrium replicatum]